MRSLFGYNVLLHVHELHTMQKAKFSLSFPEYRQVSEVLLLCSLAIATNKKASVFLFLFSLPDSLLSKGDKLDIALSK